MTTHGRPGDLCSSLAARPTITLSDRPERCPLISTQDRESADSADRAAGNVAGGAADSAADSAAGNARRAGSARSRPTPRHAPELAHLSLDELRVYRQELVTEEIRVSYWRRILQARLDLIIGDNDATALRRLGAVLTEHEVYSRRLAVQQMHVPGGASPLPDLAMLWDTSQLGEDDDGAVVSRLADAEHQLSSYRRSLHLRLDAATGELIARYHDEPALALTALPLRPGGGGGMTSTA